ncbi:MAG TPA: PGPGW domain-containing protein [Polyangiaceae bacterium]|jgi:hypothetical protein
MPERLARYLPQWLEPPVSWVLQPAVLVALVVGSTLLFVLSALGLPWFVARIPADYFSHRPRPASTAPGRSLMHVLFVVSKNALGITLLLLGVLMLVLPGQGVLTILASLFLLDFPGKKRLQRRIVGLPGVLTALNAIRQRAGQPPLELGS